MSLGRTGWALVLLLTYLALAVLFTFPLAWHFDTHHVGEAGGDARIYLWNYWWVDTAITELHTDPFETNYIFYPLGIGLSLHTLGFTQGLAFIPLKVLFGTVAGANLIILWTFLASSLGMYALARYLGASRTGAFLAGVAFAFCPARLARLAGHYDLLGTEWIPLYTWVLLKAFDAKDTRWKLVAGAGVLAALGGYTALNYLVFIAFLTLLVLIREVVQSPGRSYSHLGRTAGVVLVAGILLAPLLGHVAHDLSSWDYPPYPGAERYGANVAAYFLPGPAQTLLGDHIGRSFDRNVTETTVFPGFLLLAITAAAIFAPKLRRVGRFWLIAAFVFFVLSLGSTLKVGNWQSGIPLPFALLDELPLLHNLRAPSRFALLVMLSLAIVFALTWTHWLERLHRRSVRIGLTVAATGMLIAEYLAIPVPVFTAGVEPLYASIATEQGDFSVVEIPGVEQVPGHLMYHQTVHGKRIFIGTAARVPREKTDYYFGLHLIRPLVDLRKGKIELTPELIERERASAPLVARFLDIGIFVIDREYDKRGVLEFLTEVLPVETIYEDEQRVLLRVREEDLPALPLSIDAGADESRMYFESGWSPPEADREKRFRWANRLRSTILLRRPSSPVRELVLVVAPLEETQQRVEATMAGVTLGSRTLEPGWTELRWRLPILSDNVERLELRWSQIRQASESDPRRLSARIAEVRFE
jgi:hypothetical protein